MKIKDLAEKLGYSGNNLSNKLRDDNFSEKELRKIAELLDCDFDATFTMRDTGKIVQWKEKQRDISLLHVLELDVNIKLICD